MVTKVNLETDYLLKSFDHIQTYRQEKPKKEAAEKVKKEIKVKEEALAFKVSGHGFFGGTRIFNVKAPGFGMACYVTRRSQWTQSLFQPYYVKHTHQHHV